MSLKFLIQVIILLIILVILGSVYVNYFSNYNNLSMREKDPENNAKIDENNINKKIKQQEKKKEIEKKLPEEKKLNLETDNKKEPEEKTNKKKPLIKNLVKDVEYLTTDKKGNKYRILAKSGRTNKDDNNVLDLDEVKGFITSKTRSTIYIVSDFAKYDSSNLNSKFYQNVVINYEDKEITCENFDINMQTNIAIAYNNVVVTDPKSIMKAGKITLDIETKVININPKDDKTKVTVTTN